MDVEQYHFAQRDAVSSLHEKLIKKEQVVRGCLTLSGLWIGITIILGTRGHSVRRGCQGKERRVQDQDESTEVSQE